MEVSKLDNLNRIYLGRASMLEREHNADPISNYRHITRTLLQHMEDSTSLIRSNNSKHWNDIRDHYIRRRFLLKRYLRLIKDFEAFRQKETSTEHGYFDHLEYPEFSDHLEYYVEHAFKNLTKNSKSAIPPQ